MFKVNNKSTSLASLWYFYCQFLTHFTTFSSASIVDSEQKNVKRSSSINDFRHKIKGFYFEELKKNKT